MTNSKVGQLHKNVLSVHAPSVVGIVMILLCGCSNAKVKKLDEALDIEMVNDKYNIVFDRSTEDEWRYWDVDSIAISEGHGVLLYGKSDYNKDKKWFYIEGGERELKKGFGDWYDGEFRKYRLNEIDKDRALYNTLLSTRELWSKN